MKIHDIYDSAFVTKVTDTLNARCVGGEALTRAELCHELALTEPLPAEPKEPQAKKGEEDSPAWKEYNAAKAHNLAVEAVVGSLVTLGVIMGFEARKGPGGGLGKVGEKRSASPKDAGKKTIKNVEFPEGFLDNLITTVDTLCTGDERGTVKIDETEYVTVGCSVPRRDIAKTMGLPGSDTEVLISAALASGKLPGFASKRGVGGGICRLLPGSLPAPQPQAEEPEVTEAETQAAEPTVESEPEMLQGQAEAAVEPEAAPGAATEPEIAPEAEAAPAQPKAKGGKGKGGKGKGKAAKA